MLYESQLFAPTMTSLRPLLISAFWLLLAAASALAQGRPGARRAEPLPNCLVSEFRAMALGTPDTTLRHSQASDWLRRNLAGCSEEQLRLLASNRSAWLGTADSTQMMALMDGALEAKLKNRPDLLVQMFGATPPPRPATSDTVRAGELAPRPAPVVAPGTPAVVAPAVLGMPVPVPGMAPGAPAAKPIVLSDKVRAIVRDYFLANRGNGPCPPDLTLKGGKCESSLAQRAWKIGHALPAGLNLKDPPAALLEKMGPLPDMHKVVQVGADLLVIDQSSGLVVESLVDLGGIPPKA